MANDLNELYQEIILDHSKCPRNFQKLECANRVAQGYNPLCGDQVTVFLDLNKETIRNISFQGTGCAICKAAASLMTATLKGKTTAEAKNLFDGFHVLVTTGKQDNGNMGKLNAFAGVHKYPARVKCAILPWHAVVAALGGQKDPVTSE
jgi:nitrogen fixation protein NifU and related proteins